MAGTETTLPQSVMINVPDLRSSPAPVGCSIFQNDTESAETISGTRKLINKILQVYCIDLFVDLKLLVYVI